VWRVRRPLLPVQPPKPIEKPWFAVFPLGTLAVGLPLAAAQIAVSALYVLILFRWGR
jgi:hypothetical protein